jgi:hypothetical protein
MVASLEEYVAQATNAYQPAQTAIQNQIDALSGQLATTNEQINKNYAQQQAGLNRQRNMAAENASMQAAGSGGSFGGAANIANRKYYDQAFVPAVTQMNTNKSNDLANARQNYENQLASYNAQKANLEAQAQQQALQQYWAAKEAEEAREAQLRAARISAAAANPYRYLDDGYSNSGGGRKAWNFGNGYQVIDNNGEAMYTRNGNEITRGQFLEGTGSNTQWNLWNDIWNSGTRTNGIGSDTVQAYKDWYQPNAPRLNGNTASLKNSKYGYLY